ncbi:hypothetical protein EDD11_009611 [Mortierella claussenii]|nr:hypothetical protein EDD11_009611 [Mortierella claussenii]
MKLLLIAVSSLAAFAGLASASLTLVPQPSDDDARRLRLEPEFGSLFTNASFVRDPAYKKDLTELNEMVVALNGGIRRSNSAKAAAASPHDAHGRHYCVGNAWGPHRTRIFENRMDCNIEGWTTLVSFCVPKTIVKSKFLLKIDGCVGKAENPTRSMYFSDSKNCNRDGWSHDFSLATQTTKDLSGLHFLRVWQAWGPHRINFSPGGDNLTSSGWIYRDYIPAYTITYPTTPSGIETLKPILKKAVTLHKRILPILLSAVFTITMAAIAQQALEHLRHDAYNPAQGEVFQNFDDVEAVQSLSQELMGRRVPIQLTRGERVPGGFEGHMVTIHLVVNGSEGAIVSMDENVNFGRSWIREAILRSMMNREPVTLFRARDMNTHRYRGYLYSESGGQVDLGLQ